LIIYAKGQKVAGFIKIDLAEYLNRKEFRTQEKQSLAKCPDQSAYLSYEVQLIPQQTNPEM